MGYWSANKTTKSYSEWAKKEYSFETELHKRVILDVALVNFHEVYMAAECTDKQTGVKFVYCMVAILRKDHEGDLMVKIMDETAHPYYHNCPKRIMIQLSPIRKLRVFGSGFTNVKAWRQRVQSVQAKKDQIKSIKAGDKVRFNKPIRLSNGAVYDTFTKIKTGVWDAGASYLIRLGKSVFTDNEWVMI